ncbi:lasso peptide biosynthesis B2 protein [Steroidobacter cummioxidans]|uniref:lasso peptide biosynthesis B2 protein n=1 Tax=Steroidobacter cummioxidans TaxID=1803913 RepID=UPI00137AAD90|nr:lasso peptide biosynthesis B2 protein [Steroidobacter cummioxidans]
MSLVDDGAIFLDLSGNAYLGIDAATRDALRTSLVGLDESADRSTKSSTADLPIALAALVRRGLITDSASLGRPFSRPCVRLTHALPFGTGRRETRISMAQAMRFVIALTRASIMIRRGQLSRLTAHVRALKARLSTSGITEAQDVVALVHVVRRLSVLCYTPKNACLLDSAILAELLIEQGHAVTLVFGVRTKPFLAHAWVQMDTCVLNDSLEHAQTLTPILAI